MLAKPVIARYPWSPVSPDNRSTDKGLDTRTDLPSEQVATRSRAATRSSRPPKRRAFWALGGLAVLIVAVIAAVLILTGNSDVIPGSKIFGPKRAAFTFTLGKVRPTALGKKHSKKISPQVAASVQETLSDVYGGLFLDPKAWSSGAPDDTFSNDFTGKASTQAQADAASLGLGQLTGQVSNLKVESSSLDVNVLLDPHSHPTAAIGKVRFVAMATLKNGRTVEITNTGNYVMEQSGGKWLVAGYLKTRNKVAEATPSPSPSASGGSS
jgi:hypothetical protein